MGESERKVVGEVTSSRWLTLNEVVLIAGKEVVVRSPAGTEGGGGGGRSWSER